MKKLSILLLTVFVCAASFAQDTIDSSRVAFFRNSKTQWREVNNFTSGVVNDSIRGIIIGGVKFERVDLRSTTFDAQELGIMADGTDQAAKIAYKLSKSFVKRVRFTSQGGSNFVISSALTIPAGVEVDIENGLTISATLNFNGNIVNADPTKVIFPTGGSYVRNIRTKDNYTPAIWFGAVGNGSTDNAAFFNNAQLAGVVGQKVLVSRAASFYQINSIFTQGVDFISKDSADIRYNPSSSATAVTMWQIASNGALLQGLKLNASDKARRLIYVMPNVTDVKIIDNDLSHTAQVGSETSTVELVFFQNGNDNLYIARNYFHHSDAKNDGINRAIRGDYAGAAPRNVVIEDNTFHEIHDTFAGSDDSDNICLQSFTGLSNFIIRRNKHNSIWKRGIKLMVNGVRVSGEQFNSTRYSAYSQRAYSAISIYGSNIVVEDLTVDGGIYDNTIEIGANGQTYKNIWVSRVYCYTAYDASLITGADGFRWFGDLENVHVDDVFTQYNRYNYYIDATYRDLSVNKAIGNYSSSNSFTNVSGSAKWGDGLKITNCKAKKSGNSIAFDFWRVRNFTFTGNETDSCSNGTPNTVTIRVDSLLGYTVCHSNKAIGTWTTQANYGTYANRPAFSNSNAGIGWQYFASDSNKLYIHVGGGIYVAFGGSGGGVAWSDITGKPSTFTPSSHTHAAADITSGVFNTARLGTGTANSGKVLYGDGTWKDEPGGGTLPTKPDGYLLSGTGSAGYDSTGLYWDKINKRLGVGTASPGYGLEVNGTGYVSGIIRLSQIRDLTGTTNGIIRFSTVGVSFENSNASSTRVQFPPSVTGASSFNVKAGTPPTSPNVGDFYVKSADNKPYYYDGTSEYDLTATGGGGSGTVNSGAANRLAYYPSSGTTVDDLTAITASRALVSDANGLPVAATTTATEIGYVNGVTSAIQTQLNGKAASSHTHTQSSITDLPTVAESIYTPTFTGSGTYLTASGDSVMYTRVGSNVEVAGYATVTVNGTGTALVNLTLPVTTSHPGDEKHAVGGVWISNGSSFVGSFPITPLKDDNKVLFAISTAGATTYQCRFKFSYRIYNN